MFLPIGDVNPTERTPYVNYGLLAVNVAVFLMFGTQDARHYADLVRVYGLVPVHVDPPVGQIGPHRDGVRVHR